MGFAFPFLGILSLLDSSQQDAFMILYARIYDNKKLNIDLTADDLALNILQYI